MVFNFLNRYLTYNKIPKNLIDDNTKIDYSKLIHLIILDKKLNGNFSVLKTIIENKKITADIKSSFSVNEITNKDNFISLLYYFGLITISDYKKGKYVLQIPNEAIQTFFNDYIKNAYSEADIFKLNRYKYSNLLTDMAYDGKWQEVLNL